MKKNFTLKKSLLVAALAFVAVGAQAQFFHVPLWGQLKAYPENGGKVYAKGGREAAGIGGGDGDGSSKYGNGGKITITGGDITADTFNYTDFANPSEQNDQCLGSGIGGGVVIVRPQAFTPAEFFSSASTCFSLLGIPFLGSFSAFSRVL